MPVHDWSDDLGVRCLGVDLIIRSRGPELAIAVREAWRDAEVVVDGPDVPTVTVGLGPGFDVSGTDIDNALHHLSPAVTQRVIAARAGDLLMLHAAALADPDTGATAVLVAPSGTGKTTASRTLGQHYAYLSDETAGISRNGEVVPHRKPLSILDGGVLKSQRSASSLGLATTERTCSVAAVLVLERRHDHHAEPSVTRLDTVDAIALLAPQSSYLPSMDRPLHRIADILHRAGGARQVTYGEAHTLMPVLTRILGAGA